MITASSAATRTSKKVIALESGNILLCNALSSSLQRLQCQVQKTKEWAHDVSQSQSFPHFIGGIAAGLMECLVGHPLDTIRVRIMTSGSMGPSGNVNNMWMQELAKAFSSPTGILDIYRGSGAELLSSAMAGCLLYGVNEWIKIKLNCDEQEVLQAKDENDIYRKCLQPGLVIAAGTVGLMDGLISKPLEMIKLRQQFSATHFYSFRQAGRIIVEEGGYSALFRGSCLCAVYVYVRDRHRVDIINWRRALRTIFAIAFTSLHFGSHPFSHHSSFIILHHDTHIVLQDGSPRRCERPWVALAFSWRMR